MLTNEVRKNITVYCHFSFKRPNKGADGYGLFAVAFYRDFEGKHVIYHITRKLNLWENHQFITAIQSYEHALRVISEVQGAMLANNINQVMLVTDNSTLAGWIENHKKNKAYTKYMLKAVEKYRSGAPKEIMVGLGLCDVREYEKSYKYCNERYAQESEPQKIVKDKQGGNKLTMESIGGTYMTASQMMAKENKMPKIEGITEL